MTPIIASKIPEYKKKAVDEMADLMRKRPIIALVNMSDMPAPQLQSIRREMKGKISLYMTKKRLMKIALDKSKGDKKNLHALADYFEGMPAFLFSDESPFRLSRMLQKSRTKAPAKSGQIAPYDIMINKGPTPFAPGPIISELSGVGLKVGVESGKVAVKEDSVIVKKGEKIKPKVAEILTRLDIRPMDVGLGMVAAYENGIIYSRDVLEIDEKAFNGKLSSAAAQAFNLAFNITYVTKENVNLLISKAFNDAKAIGIERKIIDSGILEDLLGSAERGMLSLKEAANIPAVERPGQETKSAEGKLEAEHEKKQEELKPKAEHSEKPETAEEKQKSEIKSGLAAPEEPGKKGQMPPKEEKGTIGGERSLEQETPKDTKENKEQEGLKKEEKNTLEKESIGKKEKFEKAEKSGKAEEDVDEKVRKMVEKTKKFAEGKEENASNILEEVEREEKKETARQQGKKQDKTPANGLKGLKESGQESKEKNQKEVEDLTKELIRKGTLRK